VLHSNVAAISYFDSGSFQQELPSEITTIYPIFIAEAWVDWGGGMSNPLLLDGIPKTDADPVSI